MINQVAAVGGLCSARSFNKGSTRLTCLLGGLAFMTSGPVLAQEAAGVGVGSQAGNNSEQLTDIVVTAERREQNVQTTPIAIASISGETLQRDNVVQVNDLQRVTPSLSVQDAGITKFINIRGVGLNGSAPGLSTGVAYHIDGLFTRELGLTTPYYDLERVEVLRGPQGTLAGQNATGGAIFVVSKTPDLPEMSGSASLSYGNYDHLTADAALNMPVSDSVGLRFAGYYEKRDSYITNIPTGGSVKSSYQPGNLDRFALRASLMVKPTGALQILIRGEHAEQRTDGFALKDFAADPINLRQLHYNTPTKADVISDRVSAEIKWDIGDAVQLRSLTGYQRYKLSGVYATDGIPFTTLPSFQNITQPIFSQELNLVSTGHSAFQWVLGAYYFTLTSASQAEFAPAPGAPVVVRGSPRNTSKAVFAQGTYRVNELIEIVAGVRYNTDRDSDVVSLTIGGGTPILQPLSRAASNATTGKVGVNLYLNDNHFLYAVASKGYRAGGTNLAGPNFGPETIYNYEIGWKGTMLDRHLRAQVDGFFDTYDSVQLSYTDPASHLVTVVNGGGAKTKGIEAQLQAVFGGFRVDATGALLDSSLGAALVPDAAGNLVQVKGRQLVLAPKQTLSVGAEYGFGIDGDLTLTPRLQYSHVSGQWATVFHNIATDFIRPYGVLNASLTLEAKRWELSAYVTNATDKFYTTGGDGVANFIGAPREYGVRLRAKL